ncbi:MAG TPA: hypothetical protein VGO79_13325, partial [Thermoanaerobaculia bacterium]
MVGSSGTDAKRPSGQRVVMLLVGGLVGFAAGYFAAGGGRPSMGHTVSSESGPAAGRAGEIQKAVDRDP